MLFVGKKHPSKSLKNVLMCNIPDRFYQPFCEISLLEISLATYSSVLYV